MNKISKRQNIISICFGIKEVFVINFAKIYTQKNSNKDAKQESGIIKVYLLSDLCF